MSVLELYMLVAVLRTIKMKKRGFPSMQFTCVDLLAAPQCGDLHQ